MTNEIGSKQISPYISRKKNRTFTLIDLKIGNGWIEREKKCSISINQHFFIIMFFDKKKKYRKLPLLNI